MKRSHLTDMNRHKLNLWLDMHKDIAAIASDTQLAARAEQQLGFRVTDCNIRTTRKVIGAKRLYIQIATK